MFGIGTLMENESLKLVDKVKKWKSEWSCNGPCKMIINMIIKNKINISNRLNIKLKI